MTLPAACDTHKLIQLRDCVLKVARYGAEEQRLLFQSSLAKHASTDEAFFMPILHEYQQHLASRLG